MSNRKKLVVPTDFERFALANASAPATVEMLRTMLERLSKSGSGRLVGDQIADIIDGEEQIINRTLKVLNADTGEATTVIQIVDNDVRVVNNLFVGDSIGFNPTAKVMFVRAGGFIHVWGTLFGGGDNLFEWIGADVADFDACLTTNAYYYRAVIGGSLVEGGSGSTGLNYSDEESPATVGETVSVTHGPGGTSLGNDIVVTMSYRYSAYLAVAGGGGGSSVTPIEADLILTRAKGGGAASTVATPTATGERVVVDYGSSTVASEIIDWSDTYTDPDNDTDERVFTLELDASDGSFWTGFTSVLSIGSNEEA